MIMNNSDNIVLFEMMIIIIVKCVSYYDNNDDSLMIMMNHNDNIVLFEMIIIIIAKCVSYYDNNNDDESQRQYRIIRNDNYHYCNMRIVRYDDREAGRHRVDCGVECGGVLLQKSPRPPQPLLFVYLCPEPVLVN